VIEVVFNTGLIADYQKLWDTMVIKPELMKLIQQRVNSILVYRKRYEAVAAKIKMPWYLIACIHSMEGGLSFEKHLHNGDSLKARTVRVPPGRPHTGTPPFTWEDSAYDALIYKGFDKITSWSVPRMLYTLEGYNGYGYRQFHPQVKSPYLWSFTTHYKIGKYDKDGHFDPELVSQQIGAAVLLKLLMQIK